MANSTSISGGAGPMIDSNASSPKLRDHGIDRDAMLSLMSDEYARDILDAIGEQSLSARELLEHLDASRATVYRRLDRLESAGILESTMSIHPDGHHRKEFRISVEGMHLTFGAEGITVELTT